MRAATIGIGYLDGPRVRRAMRAGVRRVIEDQEHLNKINVYPVPDGDTGTNLALTMSSIEGALRANDTDDAGEVFMTIADAALDGARGNSGAIVAQFLQGVSDALTGVARVQAQDFALAVKTGETYARDALAKPVEGTVLSVMREFADRITDRARDASQRDFVSLWRDGLETARRALADTPRQLEVLRKAGVVDAGAEGFVRLLHGIHDYITAGRIDQDPAPLAGVDLDEHRTAGEEIDLDFRYCTECVVTAEAIDRRKLKEALMSLGSSLVLAGTHSKTRIHIHVNDPGEVFDLAAGFGTVSATKADDMRRQQALTHHEGAQRTVVMMDSAGDIPDEDMERLGVHMTPVRLHFGSESYLDKVTITADEFYAKLRTSAEPPKTSQPAPGDFRREFQFLASHYASVVCINVTSKASGTWQAALSAAERSGAAGRIHVFDSQNVSVGQGLITLYAAECARAGMGGEQIVAALEPLRARTKIYALVRDLDAAVRGGRLPAFLKRVVDFFRLTPVLGVRRGGRIGALGILPGRRRSLGRFHRFVQRRIDPAKRYRLSVGHTDCREEAQWLFEQLCAANDNFESTYFTRVGSALGAHTGDSSLVVALQEYAPPPAASG